MLASERDPKGLLWPEFPSNGLLFHKYPLKLKIEHFTPLTPPRQTNKIVRKNTFWWTPSHSSHG